MLKTEWETKKFSDVLDIRNGRNQKAVESESGTYPILGSAGNIMGYATDYICEAGTTIIGRKGNISTPIYIETKFWNVDTAFGLSPKAGLNNKFLYYYCLSYDFAALNRGTTIPSLVKSELLEIPIPLPTLPEQTRIVAILDEAFANISQAVANAEKNLANARELFDSYLNEVFTHKGWGKVSIDDIAKVTSGNNFKSEDFSSKNTVKSIKITNVGVQRFISSEDSFLPKDFDKKYPKFKVSSGSIVIALTRSIISDGLKVAIVPDDYDNALLNQRVAALMADQRKTSNQYLFFFLCSNYAMEYVLKKANTLMQPNLSINDLKKLELHLPSLNLQLEQQKALLHLKENTLELEDVYRRKLAALAELKQALLQKAFTGELTAADQPT